MKANFYGNLIMVNKYYKLFNEIHIIDTSESLEHKVLLHLRDLEVLSYTTIKNLPNWFVTYMPNLLRIIIKLKIRSNFMKTSTRRLEYKSPDKVMWL